MLAGLDFGRATKLHWLGDSLNTAKQLVLPGGSLVEDFTETMRWSPGGPEGPGGLLRSKGDCWTQGARLTLSQMDLFSLPSCPRVILGSDFQEYLGAAASGTRVGGTERQRLGFLSRLPLHFRWRLLLEGRRKGL